MIFEEDDNDKIKIYLARNGVIVKTLIKEESFQKKIGKFSSKLKNSDLMIFIDWENNTHLVKGQKVPFNLFNFQILKTYEPFYQKTRDFKFPKKDIKKDIEFIKSFFNKIITKEYQVRLKEIKKEIDRYKNDEDNVYRFYHHSFKMYKNRESIFNITSMIVELIGECPEDFDHLIPQIKELKLDNHLIQLVEKVEATHFCLDRNSFWIEDATILYGSYHLILEHTAHLIHMIEDFIDNKGFLFSDHSGLDSYEASALYTVKPFSNFRYNPEEFREALPELLSIIKTPYKAFRNKVIKIFKPIRLKFRFIIYDIKKMLN